MKVRLKFVSNSSSSSFIIGLNRKPKNASELEKVLYPDGKGVYYEYGGPKGEGETISAKIAAAKIWKQLKDQKPLTQKQILEEIRSGYFPDYPDYPMCYSGQPSNIFAEQFRKKYNKSIFEAQKSHPKEYQEHKRLYHNELNEWHQEINLAAKRCFKKYHYLFVDKEVFVVSIGDSHGVERSATLEHSNTFKHVNCLVISHH